MSVLVSLCQQCWNQPQHSAQTLQPGLPEPLPHIPFLVPNIAAESPRYIAGILSIHNMCICHYPRIPILLVFLQSANEGKRVALKLALITLCWLLTETET